MSTRAAFLGLAIAVLPTATACSQPSADAPAIAAGTQAANAPATAAPPADGPTADAISPKPATKEVDLGTLPLLAKAENTRRTSAGVTYRAPSAATAAFALHQKQFLDAGWREAEGSSITDQSASGTFTKAGSTMSLMVFRSSAAEPIHVTIINHGDINLAKLPTPADATSMYTGPTTAMFLTKESVESTADFCSTELGKLGWKAYGENAPLWMYKRDLSLLTVMIQAAPAQGNATMIQYTSQLISADLPAPDGAVGVQYSDGPVQLFFDTTKSKEDVDAFYRKLLPTMGWQPTLTHPIEIDNRQVTIFRNPAKDLLELQMNVVDGKSRVLLKHQTAAEVAELDRLAKAAAEKRQAEKNKPLPQFAFKTPAAALELELGKKRIEFKCPIGKGQAFAKAASAQFAKAGWKQTVDIDAPEAGVTTFTNGEQSVSISFVDPGVIPAEISLTASGVEFAGAAAAK